MISTEDPDYCGRQQLTGDPAAKCMEVTWRDIDTASDVANEPDAPGRAEDVERSSPSRARDCAVADQAAGARLDPLLSAVVAFIAGAALVSVSWPWNRPEPAWPRSIYTAPIVAMFTVSARYHRVTGNPRPRGSG